MSGMEIHLEEWLREAVEARVVTLSEAWEIQDELLLSMYGVVAMPERLARAAERLHLYEVELPTRH